MASPQVGSWLSRHFSVVLCCLALVVAGGALAGAPEYNSAPGTGNESFATKYPTYYATNGCGSCHTAAPALHVFGTAYRSAINLLSGGRVQSNVGPALTSIEQADSDADGYRNVIELSNNRRAHDATDRPTASVALSTAQNAQTGAPSSVVAYPVTVTNNGNLTDSFTLAVSVTSGQTWTTSLSGTANNVAAGGTASITVNVSVASNATVGQTSVASVTATSQANGSVAATPLTLTTGVLVTAPRYVNAASGANTTNCTTSASPCKTITYAMSQATTGSPGDAISVAAGTYNVALGEVFPIAIKSGVQLLATGTSATTVIDATGANTRVFDATSSNSSTLIQGFTIMGGRFQAAVDGSFARGGALLVSDGSPQILRNVFTDNQAIGYQGTGSTFVSGGQAAGGAISVVNGSPTIVSNVFSNNKAQGGAGKSNLGLSTAGSSGGNGQGGAIYLIGGGVINNNTFHGNQAKGGTGGFSLGAGGTGGNATSGAVYCFGANVNNNIFAANDASAGAGGGSSPSGSAGFASYGALQYNNPPTDASNNLFFGNTVDGAASGGDTVGSNAIQNQDPLFHSAPTNLRIRKTSPAKSPAGTSVGAPATDHDGVSRPSLPSIGAFEAVGIASTTVLVSSANPAPQGQSVTFTATVSGSGATPTGSVAFKDGATAICAAVALASGQAQCVASSLTAGTHSMTAEYAGDSSFAASTSSPLSQVVTGSSNPTASLSPTSVDFGGQSMGTTSPPSTVTVTNIGGATLTISSVSVSSTQFAQTNNCTSLASGASCQILVTFSPAVTLAALNATAAVTGTLVINSNGVGAPNSLGLAGSAQKSLVTHYYRSILRRAPDSAGLNYWQGDSARVAGLGANVNEAWYAMAMTFYNSPEYLAFNRDNTAYVTDLYNTFFNRGPDSAGIAFWSGELASGLPREVLLVTFMFSTEFTNFTRAIFGNSAARAEVDTVMDFFRGILSRLPDSAGFDFWVRQFRTAQCQGGAAVTTQAESISSAYVASAEYTARNRTNTQFVGDMYNAFLRRGGDRAGVQFWIAELDSGARIRGKVRQDFMASPEFNARLSAIVAQGCL